ncbi:peptidylprolyl isomerase [Aeoliella mucimassa]|uniref:peptidylprolyl isomerase n=1 Tax=Aeoliella mucimassa TaxID=2527972 RepID=A0A518AL93_9BACT|nr:peptidylprolyl isomerase [Aeoliella mucimassa]QDU55512.1 Putative peptidyl-prolyl cis-trans isomerase [Aeoliella mucimassa]
MNLRQWYWRYRRPSRRPARPQRTFQTLEPRWMMAADTVGDESLINDLVVHAQSTAGSQMAVGMSDSNSVVVYSGAGATDNSGVFAKVYDSDGDVLLEDFQVNSTFAGTQSEASVEVFEDGSFVITWSGRGEGDSQGIFMRMFDADGAALGDEVLVNTTVGGKQFDPAIAMASDGSFAIGWSGQSTDDSTGVYLQRFDADGEMVGDEVLVNTTTEKSQTGIALVFDSEDVLVASWSSMGQDGSDWGVYGQRYDTDGELLGEEFAWNTTTDDAQQNVSLAAGPDGEVVAIWQSREQDGDGWGIVARVLASDGETFGDEILVNDETEGQQYDAKLAIADDGSWLVTWTTGTDDGAGWEVAARSFDEDGTPEDDSFAVNQEMAGANSGHQHYASVAIQGDKAVIVWSGRGTTDRYGVYKQDYDYELEAQVAPDLEEIDDDNATVGVEYSVTVTASDENSRDTLSFYLDTENVPEGATIEQIDNNTAVIRWTATEDLLGETVTFRVLVADDGEPVMVDSEEFTLTVVEQEAPVIDTIDDGEASVDEEYSITITATDINTQDTLTFSLDGDNSPADATIEQTDNNTAIIRWTPSSDFEGTSVNFRVVVTDDGDPVMEAYQDFTVEVLNTPLTVDLNGEEVDGTDTSTTYAVSSGAVAIVEDVLVINGAEDDTVSGATVVLDDSADGTVETLAVDVLDTAITASYDTATGTLTLTGSDTAENYARVLRTLTYENSSDSATGSRTVSVSATDSLETSELAEITISIGAMDLVSLAQAITDSGAKFYGAAWCENCTEQKELFEDGAQLLPFVESSDENRELNDVGEENEIEEFPTWVFADGTRLVGVQSLQTLAAAAGVTIPVSDTPYLAEIADDTLLVGSPLLIPLDGYDPAGGALTYTITTDNADVTAELLTGNRSMVIDVEGYGDLVFQLFENYTPTATQRIIDLAMADFYDGVSFHRVLNNFVIQGGDPDGDGTGGSDLGDFDDEFNLDLQHNRTGLLSFAKSADDTNDSQFFITEGDSDSRPC